MQENKQKVDISYVAKQKEITDLQASLNVVLQEMKGGKKSLRTLKRSHSISSISIAISKSSATQPKLIARPSNFQLFVFDAEVLRLEKSLRVASR